MLVVLWRGWRLPEKTGGVFFEKRAVFEKAEMVLGDVSAPQTAVRPIWGARRIFYGREGLISPASDFPDIVLGLNCVGAVRVNAERRTRIENTNQSKIS